jgi:hypothetical protein
MYRHDTQLKETNVAQKFLTTMKEDEQIKCRTVFQKGEGAADVGQYSNLVQMKQYSRGLENDDYKVRGDISCKRTFVHMYT